MEALSQSQIDDLLNSLTSGAAGAGEAKEDAAFKEVKEYDFRSPKRLSKEQLKIISGAHKNCAALLSSYLAKILRLNVNVQCSNIEERRYSELNHASPDSVISAQVELRFAGGENNVIIIDAAKPVAFAIIERLLGGSGDGFGYEREFTEIDILLLEDILKGALSHMRDSWAKYCEADCVLLGPEVSPRPARAISADEAVVILTLDIDIKKTAGTISICIPVACLEEVLKKINSSCETNPKQPSDAGDKERRQLVMQYLSESDLELRCIIGQAQVTLGDVMYLGVGDILQLDKPVDSPVDLGVGDCPWFRGKIGIRRNKKAFQVTEVL